MQHGHRGDHEHERRLLGIETGRPAGEAIELLEAHDAVKGGQGLGAELIEHPGRDPLVTAGPKRGV